MLAFAASPAITGGPLTAGDFRYTVRQVVFAAIAVGILCGVSLLPLRQIRILAAVTFACALIGSFLVLFVGADVLGARRELNLGPFALQPSEFLKPSFAILAAAVLADRQPLAIPKPVVTFLLIVPALAILIWQPDVGQTGLLLCLWGAMLFFCGRELSLGRHRRRRCWRCWALPPMKSSPMSITGWSNFSAIPIPAIRPAWRSRLLPMAGWPASVPARAPSNTASPTPIPTSSSRWRARSSACCCAA